MVSLKAKTVHLRALEPTDLDFVYEIENDESIWEVSNTQTPFSRYILKKYLDNAHKDIYEVKQLRLAICKKNGELLGLIDLFDCDFKNRKAGIGIVIKSEENRNKGFGSEALELMINYAFNKLNLHQLHCNIAESNERSIKLFKSLGFEVIGLKKDWVLSHGKYNNEYSLQLIKPDES